MVVATVAWRTPPAGVIDGCGCGLRDGADVQFFGDGVDVWVMMIL